MKKWLLNLIQRLKVARHRRRLERERSHFLGTADCLRLFFEDNGLAEKYYECADTILEEMKDENG